MYIQLACKDNYVLAGLHNVTTNVANPNDMVIYWPRGLGYTPLVNRFEVDFDYHDLLKNYVKHLSKMISA